MVKLVFLDSNEQVTRKITSALRMRYMSAFELVSFTDPADAMAYIRQNRTDVFLADKEFTIDTERLPTRCGFAYLVDSPDVCEYNAQRAICKYQSLDQLYAQIMDIYVERAEPVILRPDSNENCRVIAFCSASGGVGTSTVAAACAIHYAKYGEKTIYLNLEPFGSAELYFSGVSMKSLYDVILALKSNSPNLEIKFNNWVKQDKSGVYFFAPARDIRHMLNLDSKTIIRMLEILRNCGYQNIILDMPFSLREDVLSIYRQVNAVVLVGDGSAVSNQKTETLAAAIELVEQKKEAPLYDRMYLLYNRFSSRTSKKVRTTLVQELGGFPVYRDGTTEQILEQLSERNDFDKIS